MTLDEAIKHCLEVAEQNEAKAEKWQEEGGEEWGKTTACRECATDHRQLAEWLMELKELRNSVGAVKLKDMKDAVGLLQELNTENNQLTSQLADAKRLLKAAVEDFAKLDRVNTKVRNCMMPDMDCADCPLSWDSVDDSVEPCHNWRYTNEALKLIES